MITKILIKLEMAIQIRQEMVVFGDSGGIAAVTSQFLIEHHKYNYHAKFQDRNSIFDRVPALVLKRGTSAPLPRIIGKLSVMDGGLTDRPLLYNSFVLNNKDTN